MKNELKAMLEVIEEKINKEEDRLELIDLDYTTGAAYNYHLGRLGTLREVESMLKDLLEDLLEEE